MKSIEWFERQIQKDKEEINNDKIHFIKKIRKVGVNEVVNYQKSTTKTTWNSIGQIWRRIKKNFKFLKDCAEVSEKLNNNENLNNIEVSIDINPENFIPLLREIEESVKTRVMRNQSKNISNHK